MFSVQSEQNEKFSPGAECQADQIATSTFSPAPIPYHGELFPRHPDSRQVNSPTVGMEERVEGVMCCCFLCVLEHFFVLPGHGYAVLNRGHTNCATPIRLAINTSGTCHVRNINTVGVPPAHTRINYIALNSLSNSCFLAEFWEREKGNVVFV